MGPMVQAVVAEIRRADTSQLPWAVNFRAAHARVTTAVGTALPAPQQARLKAIVPMHDNPGAAVVVPDVLSLIEVYPKALRHNITHTDGERRLAALLTDNTPSLQTHFMLVSGAGTGASSFMAPPLTTPETRCMPQIYRVALRRGLMLEPLPGTAALVRAYDQKCPDCSAQLGGCDVAVISEHLCSCGGAGGWNHQAKAMNGCVQSMFRV
jgi:hypothetical protein